MKTFGARVEASSSNIERVNGSLEVVVDAYPASKAISSSLSRPEGTNNSDEEC